MGYIINMFDRLCVSFRKQCFHSGILVVLPRRCPSGPGSVVAAMVFRPLSVGRLLAAATSGSDLEASWDFGDFQRDFWGPQTPAWCFGCCP